MDSQPSVFGLMMSRQQSSGTPSFWAVSHTFNAQTPNIPHTSSFASATTSTSLASYTAAMRPKLQQSVYWHVDDVAATLEKLLAMGATEYEPLTNRGVGFITASVVDPFGNILGIMYNAHYLEVLRMTERS